jgi:import inner membrane translocase subunit TIM23
MSLWDSITGRKSTSSSPPSSSSRPSDDLHDTAATTTFENKFDKPDSSHEISPPVPTASPVYAEVAKLHPLAGLDKGTLDYLSLEDSALSDLPGAQSAIPSRGWSDDLCYGTGITYVSALGIGGAWGFVEGLNRTPPTAPPKLKLNSILNSVTRRGPFLGNSAAVIAIVYNLVNSSIGNFRGKHDSANSIIAGMLSGMLFKSTRGVRPMMISGGLVASAAGAWQV